MGITLAIGAEEDLESPLELHEWRLAAPGDPRQLAHDGERALLDFGGGWGGGQRGRERQESTAAGNPGGPGTLARAPARHTAPVRGSARRSGRPRR